MMMLGSEAVERRGVVWAISDNGDHPAATLQRTPNRVSPGTIK